LSAVLVYWALYPTLTGYLSRALLGSDFPSAFLVLLGLMEYPLVGFGLAWLKSRSQAQARHRARLGLIVLLIYAGAQLGAHFLLNQPPVPLITSFYSARNATAGSIRAARRAGRSVAIVATNARTPTTSEIVSGSRGEVPRR